MEYAIQILECEMHKLLENIRTCRRNENVLMTNIPTTDEENRVLELRLAVDALRGESVIKEAKAALAGGAK